MKNDGLNEPQLPKEKKQKKITKTYPHPPNKNHFLSESFNLLIFEHIAEYIYVTLPDSATCVQNC